MRGRGRTGGKVAQASGDEAVWWFGKHRSGKVQEVFLAVSGAPR